MPPLLIHVVDRLCHELPPDCKCFPHTFYGANFFFETLRTEPINIVKKFKFLPIVTTLDSYFIC